MKAKQKGLWEQEPPGFVLKDLSIRVVDKTEYARAGELLEREHYLGDLPRGRGLLQVVEYRGRWVALLDWGPAAWKPADRDEWIGWSGQQRAERLALVVMNRRFLVLGPGRMPNLASRALGLATRALPGHWEERYGYRPVPAETFTDIEQFEGACYKADNWPACGQSKGFRRHRIDYYARHGRPKKLWVKALNRNARTILTALDVPGQYRAGLNRQSPERDLPLKLPQVASLRQWLREHVDDPRASNRSYSCSSLLVLVALALPAGRHTLASIHRYGQFLSPQQRRALAVDGKWVRDRVLTVCLTDHESGAPVAVAPASSKVRNDSQKQQGETTVARALYARTALDHAVVTADALHNSRPDADAILQAGGDYLLQLKQEARHSFKAAEKAAATAPLFLSRKNPTPPTDASTPAR